MSYRNKERILKNILIDTTLKYEKLLLDFHALKNQTQEQIYVDYFTGLLNKEGFLKELKKFENKSKIENKKYGVIILDIDDFRFINTYFGWEIGQLLILNFAEISREFMSENVIVARIEGNRGAVLVYDTSSDELIQFAQKMKYRFENAGFTIGDTTLHITLSVGISISSEEKRYNVVFDEAINALAEAKDKGKNTIRVYDQNIQRKLDKLNFGKQLILKALESEDTILLEIQPILACPTKQIYGGEVLLRIKIDDRIYYPGSFIESLIHFDLVDVLEEKVIKILAETEFPRNYPLTLFLNKILHKEEKLDIIEKHILELEKIRQEKNVQFVIEITENSLMQNIEKIEELMKKYRERKIHFAIDDFGSGYTSLSYLYNFSFSFLKIDGSFIKKMVEDQKVRTIVKGIIDIAKSLNVKTIAEYIETEEQYRECKNMGIDYLQGYYFYKPLLLDDFFSLIS